MATITLEALRKQFGIVRAVDDIDLAVADGEFIALLGPSGCGKTTTLRMLAGLERVDGGRITIGGRDVTEMSARERNVAMVFQDYALYPHMTVLDNVGYPLKVRGMPTEKRVERVKEVAEQLQIDTLLDRRPSQLSGGQQQRVALARAVVHRAQVTLFDEPLSNLDTKLRLEARTFLKVLQQDVGATAVYVTHDQAEAMALADRIVVMNSGRIMQVGTPIEIYRYPANTFVAAFIGSPPMNLIDCSVDVNTHQIQITPDAAFSVNLPASLKMSGKVTLGIRPEHIHLHHTPDENRILAHRYGLQMLGSETLVIVRVGEQSLTVRIMGDETPDLPEVVWLGFQPDRIFFYDIHGERIQ